MLEATRSMRRAGAALLMALICGSCESSNARVTAPRGADAFARFAVIGGSIAAGVQSGGVVDATQGSSWPAIVAARAGAPLRQPLYRTPGCSPPLVAPLLLGRWLSGAATTARDSSCAGSATTDAPPADNLAIPGATAWAALNVTPRAVTAAPSSYDFTDRSRVALVLGSTQSQVTAMLIKVPTFVALELGFAEVFRAASGGLVVAATSYTQATPWTFVPSAVSIPVIDQIADSVAKSGAKAVVVSVPRVTTLPAFRGASDVWGDRAALAARGINVQPDCSTSANTINVAAKVPPLALAAIASGNPQPLSCADTPGAADFVLTPADVSAIDGAVTQVNAHLKSVADAHGWAFADLTDALALMTNQAGAFSSQFLLECALPHGYYISLDGIHPTGEGQAILADAVMAAVNSRYGFSLPLAGASLALRARPCP